jgi:hypothetical protein
MDGGPFVGLHVRSEPLGIGERFDVRLPSHRGSIASPEPDPEAFRLAYEEAKRGLDNQEQAVVELRSRARDAHCAGGDHHFPGL